MGAFWDGRPKASSGVPTARRSPTCSVMTAASMVSLYFVDVDTGKPAVLVASEKLTLTGAVLQAPSRTSGRRKPRSAIRSLPTTGRPTRRQLLFDSHGPALAVQPGHRHRGAGHLQRRGPGDPKFSPDGQRHRLSSASTTSTCAISNGGQRRALTTDGDENLLNGEVDWVYDEELYTPQQLLLVAGR